MKRRRHLQGGPAEDRGAALLIVLVVVTVIALGGAALLSFSDTSLRTTVALRDQGAAAYAADGAAQVAISSLQTGYGFPAGEVFKNADGTTCFGKNNASGTQNLSAFYPATSGQSGTGPGSVSIDCSAAPGTGVNAAVPINDTNRPAQAILTLGQSDPDGINVAALGNPRVLAVTGAVKSNSDINVVSGTLQSTAAVRAHSGCNGTGTIVSNPAKVCNAPTTADPNYDSEAALGTPANAVPAYQPVWADVPENCPGKVVTFIPGYYDDAKALTTLMDGTGPCAGSTWWFKPGMYYFDFHNNTNDSDVYKGTGTATGGGTANRWAITSGNLVAGTPTDSNGTVIASPSASPTIPGACQNPIKSVTAAGVQFIFGGDSQLAVGGLADAEICGTYHADRPPIALYGLKSGTATTTPSTVLKMSAVKSSGFLTPMNVINEEGDSATWLKTTSTLETSTITVSGYAPPSAIPAGSIVKSATVQVTHGNSNKYDNKPGKDKLTVTFTARGGTGTPSLDITLAPTLPNSKKLATDTFDIYGGGTSDFVKQVHDNGFTGADMAYAATLSHSGTESLDTMQIDISYVTPAFRAENITTIGSNCMRQPYSGASGSGCAVLSTSESPPAFTGAFYVQGTTYTPVAAIDLTLNNATQQVVRFGVISRSLWVRQNASFNYTGPVIEIPDNAVGGGSDPIVFLSVYVCPATTTSSCSTDPVDPAHPERGPIKALQVKAMIIDPPPPSSRQVTILSWSNLR